MRSIERFTPEVIIQPWGTETLVAEVPGATMKVLEYEAGKGGGLQYHMKKTEAFYLLSGLARVRYDYGDGILTQVILRPGDAACVIPAGTPHQFLAIEDCVVIEISTPGTNDRVNVAERYGLAVEPGTLPTTYDAETIADFEAWQIATARLQLDFDMSGDGDIVVIP